MDDRFAQVIDENTSLKKDVARLEASLFESQSKQQLLRDQLQAAESELLLAQKEMEKQALQAQQQTTSECVISKSVYETLLQKLETQEVLLNQANQRAESYTHLELLNKQLKQDVQDLKEYKQRAEKKQKEYEDAQKKMENIKILEEQINTLELKNQGLVNLESELVQVKLQLATYTEKFNNILRGKTEEEFYSMIATLQSDNLILSQQNGKIQVEKEKLAQEVDKLQTLVRAFCNINF